MFDIHPELRQVAKFVPKITFSNKNLWLINLLSRLAPAPKTPDDVMVENVFIPGQDNRKKIRLRLYKPTMVDAPTPVLLWMHGGGYVMGRPEQDDVSCIEYARDLGISVVSVDYRCAPKDPFPAALEDCYTALEWVVSNSQQLGIDHQRIAVGGASAGGGLAACLAQYAYDQGEIKPVFQLLVYPMLDDRTVLRTDIDDRRTIAWNQRSNKFGWESYLGRKCGEEDVPEYAVPARRNNLSGLAEAWIGVGTADMFYDEDVAYAQRLQEAGVPCEIYIVRGGFHGFDVFNSQIAVVQDFRKSQKSALKECFFGDGYHSRLDSP